MRCYPSQSITARLLRLTIGSVFTIGSVSSGHHMLMTGLVPERDVLVLLCTMPTVDRQSHVPVAGMSALALLARRYDSRVD